MRTILRLAIGRIRTKKARSAVICTAILLTLALFMTVVSIAVNLVSSYGMMLRLASGTDYHGYLRGATFLADGETIRDTAKLNPEIADAVISSNAGQCALRPEDLYTSELTLRLIERGADLQHFYTDITAGRFPESDAEILLNPLYFPDIRIGDTLGFYYTGYADGVVGCVYAECTVSGFIEGRTDAQLRMVMRYSDTLSETYGFSEQYLNVYFSFNDTKSMPEKADALVQDTLAAYVDPAYDVHCVLNQAYLQSSFREALNPATVFLILFSLFIVFLCSFLLICNIYSIALTQDMQTFGLLHVIGTTHRQLHGMIVIQSVLLFTVSLPPGLVLGYGIGWKLLSPLLVSAIAAEGLQFRFHLWIPLAAAVLTLGTLLWSATRPLSGLRSMPPIEAVSYSPAADLPKHFVRKKNRVKTNTLPDAGRMAWFTVARNRRKTAITALSMAISVVLFMLVATLCDYMVAFTESNLQPTDYIVTLSHTYRLPDGNTEYTMAYSADHGVGLDEEYIAAVENCTGTETVRRIRTAMTELATPLPAQEALTKVRSVFPHYEMYPNLEEARQGTLRVLIVGIPDTLFSEISRNAETDFPVGTNRYALYDGDRYGGITDGDGNSCDFAYFRDGDTVTLGASTYKVFQSAATTDRITGWIGTDVYRAVLCMAESAFLSEFGNGLTYKLLVDAKPDCYERLGAELTGLSVSPGTAVAVVPKIDGVETLSFHTEITGRMDGRAQMQETMLAMQTVGYSLAAMLFLFGIGNIVNTAFSSAVERRREFATLNAVGMTDRQTRSMLFAEGMYQCGAAAGITVFLGFPAIVFLIRTSMHALVSLQWQAGVLALAVYTAISILSCIAIAGVTKKGTPAEQMQVE